MLVAVGGCGDGGDNPIGQVVEPPPDTEDAPALAVERVYPSLTFVHPVAMLRAPGDDSRWFVVEKSGRVLTFADDAAVRTADVFLDIRSRVDSEPNEAGLLGMAFHPDFATNGEVILSYTAPGSPLTSVIARYRSFDGGATADPGSEQILLTALQPYSNHNGGHILFGPDGLLYIGLGDGGSANDPQNHAQDTTDLLGSILRIDADSGGTRVYTIPPDNPFAGNPLCTQGFGAADCPAIYAWGLRNPWRFSFDRETGQLWVADVGQSDWEEVDRVERGGNYGWRIREGAHCNTAVPNCDATGLIDPVTEYGHDLGASVTGGYVYRGTKFPSLDGYYVFADFISGRLFALRADAPTGTEPKIVADTDLNISSFAEDSDGELLLIDYSGGGLYRVVTAED